MSDSLTPRNGTLLFKPIDREDLEDIFQMYKSALQEVIEISFGWEETFQRQRFESRYRSNWFYWIVVKGERLGFICYWEAESEVHLALLILAEEKRRHGYGREVMGQLHEHARKLNSKVTLSSFRKNMRAIEFYERLGYVSAQGDEHFIEMELRNP